MEIILKNIGKVKEANIKINGITVIAGENDTGKSTISKSLYAVFNTFYKINKKIKIQKIKKIHDELKEKREIYIPCLYLNENIKKILSDKACINKKIIKDINEQNIVISSYKNYLSTEELFSELKKISKNIWLEKDVDFINKLLEAYFNQEFYAQINNIFTKEVSNIILKIKGYQDINLEVIENKIKLKKELKIKEFHTKALYLDDPLVLDKRHMSSYIFGPLHIEGDVGAHTDNLIYDLRKKITPINEIRINEKFSSIFSKINKKGIGELTLNSSSFIIEKFFLFENKNTEPLNIKNISAGLKTFIILKTLLEKGILEENGVIILDEPEIHLHPAWQVVFAELIVLIQKEFNMHILLNTHSPYFLNAIEIYSKKHNIEEKCNFYSAYLLGEFSEFKDVTNNIEEIYSKLARPFQDLENERYSDD